MSRSLLERKLADVGDRLRALRDELGVIDEQLQHLAGEADEARLRALVSETPLAEREHREAQRHADAMAKRRAEVVASVQRLETQQDELLDRLFSERG
jgi:threonine aldolase